MTSVDLLFPLRGQTLPADHGYALYAALSRTLPALHQSTSKVLVAPISGVKEQPGVLRLSPDHAKLRLRLASDDIPMALPLAGKSLDVDGHPLQLGVPHVTGVIAAPTIRSRLVVIKGFAEPDSFLEAARRQLAALEIASIPAIPLLTAGPRSGLPSRKVLSIKGKRVVGFSLIVEGLSAAESIRLQEHGLGGRPKMGCGFFLPWVGERNRP